MFCIIVSFGGSFFLSTETERLFLAKLADTRGVIYDSFCAYCGTKIIELEPLEIKILV